MKKRFDELGLPEELVNALAAQGINEPFPVQELTIPDAIAGRDVCGKAKTGSGKTLAFGLPLLARLSGDGEPSRPRALVLVPTRELASQVTEALAPLGEAVGRTVAAVYGGANLEKQVKRLKDGADIVVATPGRMIDLLDRGDVQLDLLEAFVLDEADRMADMGFLPQVEWILRRAPKERQTMLFSATLDGAVAGVIRNHLKDPVQHEVVSTTVTVDDMAHRFLQVHQMDKVKVAAAIARGAFRCLVFVRTKRGADRLSSDLQKEGVEAQPIHGDLRQQQREKALKDFSDGKLHVLVATDVAARGIHVDDIEVVIHYDPPSDHKSYLHRSGRTARAGTAGVVATLVLWNEELEVRNLQKRVGLKDLPIVEVFSNDPRLGDLQAWDPASDEAVA
jgi:superfamily II DNA/RNA helicase